MATGVSARVAAWREAVTTTDSSVYVASSKNTISSFPLIFLTLKPSALIAKSPCSFNWSSPRSFDNAMVFCPFLTLAPMIGSFVTAFNTLITGTWACAMAAPKSSIATNNDFMNN